MSDEPIIIDPVSRAAWREWLAENAEIGHGVWLVLHKGADSALRYEEGVEEALAFGWIDSKAVRLDEDRYKIWMAPRKRKSGWARSNKARVEKLMAAGLMTERGLAVIEQAKADGSWDLLESLESLEVPDDLAEALAALPHARANFDAFPKSARSMILGWVQQAKRPETRRARIDKTARLAEENVRSRP